MSKFAACRILAWLVTASLTLGMARVAGAETAVILPAPTLDDAKAAAPLRTVVLAAGCFWGVQGVYEHVRGVRKVLAGYAGGSKATADYDSVSSGTTRHAESVQITYDPSVVSFGQILQIAFSVVHDPTQLNRQASDLGSQYRSAIFYANDTQKRLAAAYIQQLDSAHAFSQPIATQLEKLKGFYPAEDHHQDFAARHPTHPYIAYYDLPKIENLRMTFPSSFVPRAVLSGAD